MDEKKDNELPTGQIPIRDIKAEPGAEDLLESPAMQPYMNMAVAVMGGKDASAAIAAIAALPLEQRYVWRVASALKWAFADFDTINVEADRQTLSPEDQERLEDILKHRPLQLCMFLKALLGEEAMQRMMVFAIKVAKKIP